MRGRRDPRITMLAFIELEERVSTAHPLRTIKVLADQALAELSPTFDPTVFTKNRERLLKHKAGQQLFDEVVGRAHARALLSDEHFTVDGTLIEAADSLKSFKPKDGEPPRSTDDDPGNPSVDFHGEKRSNATHRSTTDPDARLMRKGLGKEARLSTCTKVRHGFHDVTPPGRGHLRIGSNLCSRA